MAGIEHVDHAPVADRRCAGLRGGLDRIARSGAEVSEAIGQIVEVSVDRGHTFTSWITRRAMPTAGRDVCAPGERSDRRAEWQSRMIAR